MDVSLHSDHRSERTESLMSEADRLLGDADMQEIAKFDTLMQIWGELGLSFAERLELALEKLRAGTLPEAGGALFH